MNGLAPNHQEDTNEIRVNFEIHILVVFNNFFIWETVVINRCLMLNPNKFVVVPLVREVGTLTEQICEIRVCNIRYFWCELTCHAPRADSGRSCAINLWSFVFARVGWRLLSVCHLRPSPADTVRRRRHGPPTAVSDCHRASRRRRLAVTQIAGSLSRLVAR